MNIRSSRRFGGFVALFLFLQISLFGSPQPIFKPEGLAAIDDAIKQAVTDAKTPGGVFRMEREGAIYEKAYGDRAIFPKRESATTDTIFDAASLTKVIATTSANF